jgi:hypothetical protein
LLIDFYVTIIILLHLPLVIIAPIKYFIIKFKNNKVYLLDDVIMELSQLEVSPPITNIQENAYWLLQSIAYYPNQKRLACKVISYEIGEIEYLDEQEDLKEFFKEIQSINFIELNTNGILKTSIMPKVSGVIKNYVLEETDSITNENIQEFDAVEEQTINDTENNENDNKIRQVYIKELKADLIIAIKELEFILGAVKFTKVINGYNKPIEFIIFNEYIREEFDAVKNYIINILGKNKISVKVYVKLADGVIVEKVATSYTLNKINNSTFDNIKFEIINDILKKKAQIETTQTIFAMEEYLENYSQAGEFGNKFFNNENSLFDELLKVSNAKHYKQLRYLSGLHAYKIMKLRFVHKPVLFFY